MPTTTEASQGQQYCLVIQPIHARGFELLRAAGIEPRLASASDMQTVGREVAGACAVITRNAGLDRAAMDAAPGLAVIGVHGIGTDPVDITHADRLGIPVVFTPGANIQSVSEHAIALMLAVAKRIPDADRAVRTGNFEFKYTAPLTELYGKTLGIVGWGRIGRRTAELARTAFNLTVEVYSPSTDPNDLEATGITKCDGLAELMRRADIVSLHVPLNDTTRGMIGAAELAQMKPSAILVNTCRGAVINEEALIRILRKRQIAGAGLDVFGSETMAADNELLRLDNVVLSPHIAGSTGEALERTAVAVVDSVFNVLRGNRPANLANPAVWDRRRMGVTLTCEGNARMVAR